MFKKITLLLIIVMCFPNIIVEADNSNIIQIGEYIQLGMYQGEPIIWRCIDEDENGKLMLSDKILCYKMFDALYHKGTIVQSTREGSGCWEESTLRAWLNATETGGTIEWPGQNPPTKENAYFAYDEEEGFLSSTNFTQTELSVMKSIGQWQILGNDRLDCSENDIYFAFGYNYFPSNAYWYESCNYSSISELYHVEGAMYRLSDTVFLLNEQQVYNMWENFGTVKTEPTAYAGEQINNSVLSISRWWLRTGEGDCTQIVNNDNYYGLSGAYTAIDTGVRPAFYLNESTAVITSGSGTEDEPYIVDGTGTEAVTVFSNGEQLNFNVDPVIENDSTLVGMRTIFESLGADVEWDSDTWTVTASLNDTTVSLQIDNDVMLVNDDEVTLDVPARIINDNTMVPLRAISESLGAGVEWIENLNRIVIDKPESQVFDDNKGKENWQTGEFGDWQPDMSKYRGGWYEYLESQEETSE